MGKSLRHAQCSTAAASEAALPQYHAPPQNILLLQARLGTQLHAWPWLCRHESGTISCSKKMSAWDGHICRATSSNTPAVRLTWSWLGRHGRGDEELLQGHETPHHGHMAPSSVLRSLALQLHLFRAAPEGGAHLRHLLVNGSSQRGELASLVLVLVLALVLVLLEVPTPSTTAAPPRTQQHCNVLRRSQRRGAQQDLQQACTPDRCGANPWSWAMPASPWVSLPTCAWRPGVGWAALHREEAACCAAVAPAAGDRSLQLLPGACQQVAGLSVSCPAAACTQWPCKHSRPYWVRRIAVCTCDPNG